MFILNHTPIYADLRQIVHELPLVKVRYREDSVIACCPFHEDKTPSFGIYRYESTYLYKCFSCGAKGRLDKLITYLLRVDGTKWLLEKFGGDCPTRESVLKLPKRPTKTPSKIYELINTNVNEYLTKTRGIPIEVCKQFEVGFAEGAVLFPVKDIAGNIVYYASRNIHEKVYRYTKDTIKSLYAIDKATSNIVYVVESIINCLTLWSAGLQAVALNGTGSLYQINQLKHLGARILILALDGDRAGQNGTHNIIEHLRGYKILKQVYMPPDKDINDIWLELACNRYLMLKWLDKQTQPCYNTSRN